VPLEVGAFYLIDLAMIALLEPVAASLSAPTP
jgi:hypothetical protein